MVKYDFQIYPFSGEMFTAVNARTGVQLDAVGALPEETSIYYGGENIYNTTDFIPLNDDCRVLRIVCPVSTTPHYPYVCFYSNNDATAIVTKANFALPRRYYDEVAGQWVQIAYDPQSTVDQRVCFTTAMAYMAVPSTAKYIRVSADGKQWSSLSIQTYGAYGNIGSRTSVHPIYKEDLSIIYEREGKGRFLRRKLSSALTFIRNDFDTIMSYGFDTNIRVLIRKSTNGSAFTSYWEGEFARTDCSITYDDKKIVVTPDTADAYKSILDRYENEYNLIDLAPEVERVKYNQRALMQVYVMNSGCVQNFVGNMSWEETCEDPTNESTLINNTYRFANVGITKQLSLASTNYSNLSGVYIGSVANPAINPSGTKTAVCEFFCEERGVRLVYSIQMSSSNYMRYYDFYGANDTVIATFTVSGHASDTPDLQTIENGQTRTIWGSDIEVSCNSVLNIYARMLTNYAYDGNSTPKITSGDKFVDATTTNYTYIYTPSGAGSRIVIVNSSRYSQAPTSYGRVDSSVEPTGSKLYYLPPDDLAYYIPFAQSFWAAYSYWLYMPALGNLDSFDGDTLAKSIQLDDAFPLYSCIDVLAKQIDPRLSFKNTTDYSNFLFAQNNPLWPNAQANFNPFRYLCITQITNISRGEYTQAAQRGDACLKWFFDLLAGAFNCFWWVDSNYKIHVEHISYFDNGGSYTEGTQSVGKDLTALYDSRNSKAWSFGLGECKFETEDIASRYEYEWAMGATEVFNGNAIEILSRNIDKGKKEEVSISHFATDLDYIIGNPSSFSNDGWILLAPVLPSANATLATPVGQVNFNNYKQKDGTTYRIYVNNPYLSFAYLQQTVLTYGMPASAIICNGVITTAKSVARLMTQQVTVPYEDNEIEEGKLIRTSVGDGQIKRAEFDLESRCAKITLKYFTN